MEDYENINYQAKLEYTNKLKDILNESLFDKLYNIYRLSIENDYLNSIVDTFRKNIEEIPNWNNHILEKEINNIINNTGCDWLDDLLTAVFISHTKILLSINNKNKNNEKKINLIIPNIKNFIHKCLINFARDIWKNPYLFDENIKTSEYQKNIKIIEELINSNIDLTIRSLLPIRSILKEHLEIPDNNINEEDTNTVEALNKNEDENKTKNYKKYY